MNIKFKPSNIEWIGQIPQNWEVVRLKYILHERNESNNPIKTDFILSLTNEKGVIPYSEKGNLGNVSKENISGYKLAYPDDLVLNSMNVVIGSVGISNYFGAISPVYYALYADKNADIKFYNYIFQTSVFQNSLKGLGNGILEIRMRIPMQNLNNIFLPFPPIDEQRKISEFLDKKCAKIDDLRKGIKEKIANLKAYKSSLITKAVTGKLALSNEKLVMKDSGISWIGEIPKNWEVKKVKYFADALFKGNGITKEQVSADGDIPCIRYGEIYSKYDNSFSECFSYTFEKSINSRQYCYYGDILIAGTGELIEEIGKNIVYLGQKPCLVGGDILVLQTSQDPKFINYALDCEYARNQKSCGKAKLKVVHISSFEIANLYIALPPLEEQKRISEFLDNKCKIIDDLIANLNKQDEILSEYKKSLIYECVTGKLAMSNE